MQRKRIDEKRKRDNQAKKEMKEEKKRILLTAIQKEK